MSATAPERVNLLIPTIDLKHLFGGYIAKFNLARKLAEAGLPDPHRRPSTRRRRCRADWREQVESYAASRALRAGRGGIRP